MIESVSENFVSIRSYSGKALSAGATQSTKQPNYFQGRDGDTLEEA